MRTKSLGLRRAVKFHRKGFYEQKWAFCSRNRWLRRRNIRKSPKTCNISDRIDLDSVSFSVAENESVAQGVSTHESDAPPAVPLRTELLRNVEALLFLAREPIGVKRFAQLLSLENPNDVLDAIRGLNQIYDASHRAFRILELARGFQLRVRPQFTPWLRQLCHQGGIKNQESPEIRLSPPAMETLAIVAYREAFDTPITRAEIESIRGVQSCMEILRQLLGKDLIRIAGRSSELGRPRLYRTTKKFLEVFGLKSLLQLPKIDLH